ncbi:PREDICTED: adenylyl cyclase-associated protein 2-like [Priapulus caudatus]|uniref:Adenylyl cyclase-associated protein 2-like n=1 Tax=Priapulus caudatus TaxID=37621 RepID=A0ABM1DQ54_PRICU|nr:PREDICTED: adenylyl cyclase-associated protein 2-like [Priapulus caudatus]
MLPFSCGLGKLCGSGAHSPTSEKVSPTPLVEVEEMSAADMEKLMTRLESATVRVEQLFSQGKENLSRLESTTCQLQQVGHPGGGAAAAPVSVAEEVVEPSVLAYDELLQGSFAQYMSLSSKIGGVVNEQAQLVKDAFEAQREFLRIASKSKQPSQAQLVKDAFEAQREFLRIASKSKQPSQD